MIITCPECNKKLKVRENAFGKKVRCTGCQKVVPIQHPPEVAAPSDRRKAGRVAIEDPPPPSTAPAPPKPASTMRCAACKAAALKPLPADMFSRRPGYVCTECGAKMRRPGTTTMFVLAILFGGFTMLLGLTGVVIAAFSGGEGFQMEGGLTTMMLGAAVIAWAYSQLRLPVPLDATPRPSYLRFWIIVFVLGILAVGGAVFFFMYYLQEML